MDSILQTKKQCYVCGTVQGLHKHHVYPGIANRRLSEEYGCWVWLCGPHHNLSNDGVHFNAELDRRIKSECQAAFEQTYTREKFREVFGKSYL